MAELNSQVSPTMLKNDTAVKLAEVAPDPLTQLEAAIIETILYFDFFSYPVTTLEIQRFLSGQAVQLEQIEQILQTSLYLSTLVVKTGAFYHLDGRESIVERRLERAETSQECWRKAKPFLDWLRAIPFLRTAFVTGALAMDNAPADDDIDLLLLTAPNRLWLCRACVILVVRLARLGRVTLCPNYLLTTEVLELEERNLYTAHELAQMRFLFGKADYLTLLDKNGWMSEFLPNARRDSGVLDDNPMHWTAHFQRMGEWCLGGWLGQKIENWERRRKLARFQAGDETLFSEKICKGHYNGHAGQTLEALAARKALFPWLVKIEES